MVLKFPEFLGKCIEVVFRSFPSDAFFLGLSICVTENHFSLLQKVYSCEHLAPVGIYFLVPWIYVEPESCSILKRQHVQTQLIV